VAAAAVLVYSYRNFREIKQEQAQAHSAAVD